MVTPQRDTPSGEDPPESLSEEAFFYRSVGHAVLFVGCLALGVFGQTLLFIPFGGHLLAGGPGAGVLYAVLCGIPSSFFLILALRRRREAVENGLTPNTLEQVALLGFASTALVYGLCAGTLAVSPG